MTSCAFHAEVYAVPAGLGGRAERCSAMLRIPSGTAPHRSALPPRPLGTVTRSVTVPKGPHKPRRSTHRWGTWLFPIPLRLSKK